jgi:hypothetical protein
MKFDPVQIDEGPIARWMESVAAKFRSDFHYDRKPE